jgi:hypothetical protein
MTTTCFFCRKHPQLRLHFFADAKCIVTKREKVGFG